MMSTLLISLFAIVSFELHIKTIFRVEIDVNMSYFHLFSAFPLCFYHINFSYPYRSFKHSNWWRHNLCYA